MTTKTAAKERPLLYSGPMVKATLRVENPKTQTRRLRGLDEINAAPDYWKFLQFVFNKKNEMCAVFVGKKGEDKIVKCPYGQPGDRLWVRETFTLENGGNEYTLEVPKDGTPFHTIKLSDGEGGDYDAIEVPHYRATEPDAAIYPWACMDGDCGHENEDDCHRTRWTPAIHMPRWASRIDLEIVKVRVERLQDISEADAKAEGAENAIEPMEGDFVDPPVVRGHRIGFKLLWKSINGDASWKANPWVWVLEFKRIRP
ncbi:MAG TPA: hypothetical protein VHE12_05900 [bacterium]|nr:hypothetical protein [bacterium]